MPTVRV